MLENWYVDEISKELEKADILIDKEKLMKSIDFEISDIPLFINRIKRLVFLLKETEGDYTAKRDAYKLLSNIYDSKVLNCLADNKAYFDNLKDSVDEYERVTLCLNASLVGASTVAESLFNKNCNPKKNSYIVSYALCSGNKEWMKNFINIWNVDLSENKYCLKFYETKLNDNELSNYYQKMNKPAEHSFFKNKQAFPRSQEDPQKLIEAKCKSHLDSFLDGLKNLNEDKQISYIENALKELTLKKEIIQRRKFSPSNNTSTNE